jgi:uncharacterized protein YceK
VLRRRAILSLVLILCLLTSGCAAVIVGALAGGAAIGYYKGWLVDQVNADVPRTFEATKAALGELKMPIEKARYDMIRGKINSKLADGKHVYIRLKATEGGTTEIRVRVGMLGDKDASHRILRAIRRNI